MNSLKNDRRNLSISGIVVQIVRKAIRNLHLRVDPPHGRVRVAAQLAVTDDAVRLAVVGKLRWIKWQRARFKAQPRQSAREMVSGESHYFLGTRYRMRVITGPGAGSVTLRSPGVMELRVRPGATAEQRDRVLQQWYRRQLRELIPPLLEKWQPRLQVQPAFWGIKKMKTRWGTCNHRAGRIWLNLELIKRPAQCLEYIVVHELAHLIEPNHSARFKAVMDEHLPQWRQHRKALNSTPLGHENWGH